MVFFCVIDNPLNDGTWTYTWEKGRQLQKMQKSGESVEFKYNENGLRIQKVATSTGTTNYTLHGKNIVHMTQGSNKLHFFYDAANKPAIVEYNGTKYAYVHNLQGDIIAILDSSGTKVVSYTYDAWGKPLSTTGTMASALGKINPFRYRGYVYDEETGLYYLRDRFYSSLWQRFINADECFDTGSGLFTFSLFTYCASSPISFKDTSGKGIILACVLVFGAIGALAGGCYGAAKSEEELGYVDAGWVIGGALLGGGAGALFGWGVGSLAAAVISPTVIGTLGPPAYATWQKAEEALRKLMNCNLSQTLRTIWTPFGNRIVDSWDKVNGIIAEAKYGYTYLKPFVELQIQKDIWLLEQGIVKAVEWHFYVSQTTGQGGPSQPLLDALIEAGFTIVFH